MSDQVDMDGDGLGDPCDDDDDGDGTDDAVDNCPYIANVDQAEAGDDRAKDDFEHPNMLYSRSRNSNDRNADGIFSMHRWLW